MIEKNSIEDSFAFMSQVISLQKPKRLNEVVLSYER